MVSGLGSFEGRKSLLYVSDGIEQQGGLDLHHFFEELCPEQAFSPSHQRRGLRFESLRLFDDLVESANANRVTFYSLEAAGLRSFSSASAAYASIEHRPSALNDQIRIANLQSPLFFIAHETGGKAVLNANYFARDLEKIGEETTRYYSLGFAPSHPAAGRTHRISVKLPGRPKTELRYRRSFLHKEDERRLAEKALGTVLFGVAKNPLKASVHRGEPTPGTRGRVVLPIEVRVPIEELVLLPGEDERRGKLTLVIAAPNKRGRKIEIRKKELVIRAPLDPSAPGPAKVRIGVRIELPPGEYKLAVGVWDDVARTASFLKVDVHLDEASQGEPGASS